MPRSGEQVRGRLQQAALDLFGEHGYDSTTSAQIAERAGVTERTFFRHFRDKREVLFDGEAALSRDLARGIADAPAGLDPLAMVFEAFRAVLGLLRDNRSFAQPRRVVIDATPALRERELAKEAALTQVVAAGLVGRGVPTHHAMLAAQIGMAAFAQATVTWLDHPEVDLEAHLQQASDDLRTLTADRGAL